MDGETKLIHLRLEAWGEWSKSNPELRAFPEATLLHRVAECGPQGASQGSRPPVTMPEAVEVTELAINRLGEIDRKVVKAYYLDWAPVELLARRCHMRIKEFENVLKRARWRVGGYVSGYEERAA
jgi:DNA-directed RNA polymerase specialized sigma24 family protein